jgi:hypothetical protein
MKNTEKLNWAFFIKEAVNPGMAAAFGAIPTIADDKANIMDVLRSVGRSAGESVAGAGLGGAAGMGIGAGVGALTKNPALGKQLSGGLGGMGSLTGLLGGGVHGSYAAAKNFNRRHSPGQELLAKLQALLGK